ncbi:MAG: PIN domain-containing protein [Longimicrobiales bacterium]
MIIVADTSAVLALLDADDRHHVELRSVWEENPSAWVLPWAVLPEIDYLARRYLGARAARLLMRDIATGGLTVEHGEPADIRRATHLDEKYADLDLGLVDGVVAAVAERLGAAAIATLDVRHFGAITIDGNPRLLPRDLADATLRDHRRLENP